MEEKYREQEGSRDDCVLAIEDFLWGVEKEPRNFGFSDDPACDGVCGCRDVCGCDSVCGCQNGC